MITVAILGFGNVGQHLYRVFNASKEVIVVQVYNIRLLSIASEISTPFITKLDEIKNADVYIIATPDDAIPTFSVKLKHRDKLVVHTSGSVALEELSSHNRRGVFYPLQSFSKDTTVDFNEIPICVEAENKEDQKTLQQLGTAISSKVVVITSEERKKLHLAAVFVNNFVNHMYHISEEILKENDLDFNLLQPLIKETARKTEDLSPSQAQTGPAKRGDEKTIATHLYLLNPKQQEVYKMMTERISEKFKKIDSASNTE